MDECIDGQKCLLVCSPAGTYRQATRQPEAEQSMGDCLLDSVGVIGSLQNCYWQSLQIFLDSACFLHTPCVT